MATEAIIIRTEWLESFEELTNEEIGALLMAALNFRVNKTVPIFEDRTVRSIWKRLRKELEKDQDKYQAKIDAGRKGGLAKASKSKQNLANSTNTNKKNLKELNLNKTNERENSLEADAPTLAQIKEFFQLNGYSSDPELFEAYYSARNWQQNGVDMSGQWDKLAKTWELREKKFAEAEMKGGDPGDIGFDW